MLSREEFTDAIFDELRQQLPQDYILSRKEVLKANDTPYTAINMTREGSDVGVVIYAENLYKEYEQGSTVEEIAERASDAVKEKNLQRDELPVFDKQFILDHTYYRMANAGMNQRRFEHVPVYSPPGAEDIALYPCVDVVIDGRNGVITLSDSQIADLDISMDELRDAALANTERRVEIVPLGQVLSEMMPGIEPEMFDSPFYVSRDKEMAGGVSGASLFGAPSVISQMHGDYYIIPSSVHEVLLLPKDFETDPDKLHSLVHEVNTEVLDPEDFLSDHVYESRNGVISTLESDVGVEQHIERE